MRTTFVALIALAGCGDNQERPDAAVTVDSRLIDAAVDATVSVDANPTNATYSLGNSNSANGIHWDATAKKLYLTESNANALLSWSDAAATFSIFAQFPIPVPASSQISLGDVLENSDGSFYVTNFFAGNIVKTNTAPGMGTAVTLPVTNRRRIGLSRNPAGDVYAATFLGGGGGNQTGAITKITFSGNTATEDIVVTGPSEGVTFKKLVGMYATDDALYVTQQNQQRTVGSPDNVLYKVALPLPTNGDFPTVTAIATVPMTDLITRLPGGDFLTGCKTKVCRITESGTVTELDALGTFEEVHGVAYDAALKRLFIVNHSATITTGDKLEIRPFEE